RRSVRRRVRARDSARHGRGRTSRRWRYREGDGERGRPFVRGPCATAGRNRPIDERRIMTDMRHATGAEIRRAARCGELTSPTPGMALGYVQANLVVVPRELAFDFLLFCQRNPKPCPLLDVTEPGSAEPRFVAPGADLRTDVPRYRVFRNGELIDE